MEERTKEVDDHSRVGKRGTPRHPQAFGFELPKKVVRIRDDDQLDDVPLSLKEQLQEEVRRRVNLPAKLGDVVIRCNDNTLSLLNRLITAAEFRGPDAETLFRDEENVTHTLSVDQLKELLAAATNHVTHLMSVSWVLKDLGDEIPKDFADDKYWQASE